MKGKSLPGVKFRLRGKFWAFSRDSRFFMQTENYLLLVNVFGRMIFFFHFDLLNQISNVGKIL